MKKKIIPVLVAVVLIVIIAVASFGTKIVDKYSYSKDYYDMKVYFENANEHDVAIIKEDSFLEERAYLYDGVYYADLEFVRDNLNRRFYYDENEQLLIYCLPTEVVKVSLNDRNEVLCYAGESETLGYEAVRLEGDKVLIALDYVRQFTNFSYEAFSNPERIQLNTVWPEIQTATVKKDTSVRHRGGVKSEILKDLKVGDKVTVLEKMEEWSKVKTNDAIIGYVENKRLNDSVSELPIPVTDVEEPEYTNLCRDYKINMGWHAVAGLSGNDTLVEYVNKTKGLNVISPTWFSIADEEGNYVSLASKAYVEKAHNMGLEVWPTFNNIEENSGVDMDALLSFTTKREKMIKALVNDLLACGADGINIDIEMLPVEASRDFSEFIRELSVACRKNNLVLSIDNYVPIGNTGYYDRKTQGEVADYVVIMGYDEHYSGSAEAGSVASIGYVETGIVNTLEEVPAGKIINGIPFYTRIWETEGTEVKSRAMAMEDANEWVRKHNVTLNWDENTCQSYGETKEGNVFYQVWMEDAESVRVKLNVMDTYGIAGVAEWRLGYETPDIWDEIETYLNR